jgi:hypothetical protein
MAKEYRCPFCMKKFRSSEALAKHVLYGNCQKKRKAKNR